MALTLTNNSNDGTPNSAPGSIHWSAFSIQYGGTTYNISAGTTANTYAWWVFGDPTLTTSNAYPSGLNAEDLVVFLNKSGTGIIVPGSTVLNGDLIVPGTVLADKIAANQISSSHISATDFVADVITGGLILAELGIGSLGSIVAAGAGGAFVKMTADGLLGNNGTENTFIVDKDGNAAFKGDIFGGTISADIGFITAGKIVAFNNAGKYLWLDANGIAASDGSQVTFAIDTNGNATFRGNVDAASITASTISGTTISGGSIDGTTVTGGTVKTTGSGLRIEMRSAGEATGGNQLLVFPGSGWAVGEAGVLRHLPDPAPHTPTQGTDFYADGVQLKSPMSPAGTANRSATTAFVTMYGGSHSVKPGLEYPNAPYSHRGRVEYQADQHMWKDENGNIRATYNKYDGAGTGDDLWHFERQVKANAGLVTTTLNATGASTLAATTVTTLGATGTATLATVNASGTVTGNRVHGGAGTEGLPGLAFSSDSDTGLWNNSANQMAAVTGGTRVATFVNGYLQMDTPLYLDSDIHSSATPSSSAIVLGFTGDTDTGIFRRAANHIAFVTQGGIGLEQASNQQIRIMTAGTTGVPALAFTHDTTTYTNDTNCGFYKPANDTIGITLAGTEHFRFAPSKLTFQSEGYITRYQTNSIEISGQGGSQISSIKMDRTLTNDTVHIFAQDGFVVGRVYSATTASGANVHVLSSGELVRSTSSGRFKKDVEDLWPTKRDALYDLRPVWFREDGTKQETAEQAGWGHYGFIAEEVAEVEPAFVQWEYEYVRDDTPQANIVWEDGEPVLAVDEAGNPVRIPTGLNYNAMLAHLVGVVQDLRGRIDTLEGKAA